MLESDETIRYIALTLSKIEEVSGANKVVEYVNSFPKFRDMIEKGIGCLPETDKLVKVWEDLQGF